MDLRDIPHELSKYIVTYFPNSELPLKEKIKMYARADDQFAYIRERFQTGEITQEEYNQYLSEVLNTYPDDALTMEEMFRKFKFFCSHPYKMKQGIPQYQYFLEKFFCPKYSSNPTVQELMYRMILYAFRCDNYHAVYILLSKCKFRLSTKGKVSYYLKMRILQRLGNQDEYVEEIADFLYEPSIESDPFYLKVLPLLA